MYCTQDNFTDRFGADELQQLLDVMSGTSRSYAGAAADADALINTYIVLKAPAFPIPDAKIPGRLRQLAADITRWMLYDDRPTAEVQKRYDLAIADLKAIAAGQITFPEWSVGDNDAPVQPFAIDVASNRKVFDGVYPVMGGCEVPSWRRP